MRSRSIQCGSILLASAFLFGIVKCSTTNQTSPCPRYFTYENNTEAEDRWYGAITLLNEHDLNGVWLRVVFDRPVVHIRSTFGEAVPREGNEYLIKDHNFKLVKEIPHTVRFYVQHTINETPANLVGFRLNGKVMCPEVARVGTTTERLFTSWKTDVLLENGEGLKPGVHDKQDTLYIASAQLNTSAVLDALVTDDHCDNSTEHVPTSNTNGSSNDTHPVNFVSGTLYTSDNSHLNSTSVTVSTSEKTLSITSTNGTLFTSDNNHSQNMVESSVQEEVGTLYVSN